MLGLNSKMKIKLEDYCAPGVSFKEEMIQVSENVFLRLFTFTPPIKNNNPAIVFVPGWISMIDGWCNVLLEMTKDFTVYYLETREKISSVVKGTDDYSVEAIGQDIISVIEISGLRNKEFVLLGSSLGATSILDCCKDLRIIPSCLVLVGPNAEFRIPKFGVVLIKLFYPPLYNFFKPYVKWYLKHFRLDVKKDSQQFEKYSNVLDSADPWKLKRAALSVYKYSVWNFLHRIEIPTLILGASKDKLHEPENLKKIVSIMKNCSYVDMDTNKGTHSPQAVEEIRKYLQSLQHKSMV